MHDNIPRQRESESRDLAVIALDIRRFSSFTDTEGTRIATEFRDCVEHAFAGNLAGVWGERVFEQDAGDGIVTGFDRRHLRDIVDTVPAALQKELRELSLRTRLNVRMRMGIGVGPVQETTDERVSTAPNRAIIDACRIADSEPTRLLLENSDAYATYLAVAVTPSVIAQTIGPDPKRVRASEFVEVVVDIAKKDYHSRAYLHVPCPSGPLLQFGLINLHGSRLSADDGDAPLEERIADSGPTWIDSGQSAGDRSVQTGPVHGDLQANEVSTGAVSGGVVAGSTGDVHQDHSTGKRVYRTWNHTEGDNISTAEGPIHISRPRRDTDRKPRARDGQEDELA